MPSNRTPRRWGLSSTWLLLGALALTSCGTIEVFRFPLQQGAAAPRSQVAVHFEGEPLSSSFRELVLIESLGSGTKGNVEDVLASMVDEAGRWGASDLVRVKIDCAFGQCHGVGVAALRTR